MVRRKSLNLGLIRRDSDIAVTQFRSGGAVAINSMGKPLVRPVRLEKV
jgi:hypothetical protein